MSCNNKPSCAALAVRKGRSIVPCRDTTACQAQRAWTCIAGCMILLLSSTSTPLRLSPPSPRHSAKPLQPALTDQLLRQKLPQQLLLSLRHQLLQCPSRLVSYLMPLRHSKKGISDPRALPEAIRRAAAETQSGMLVPRRVRMSPLGMEGTEGVRLPAEMVRNVATSLKPAGKAEMVGVPLERQLMISSWLMSGLQPSRPQSMVPMGMQAKGDLQQGVMSWSTAPRLLLPMGRWPCLEPKGGHQTRVHQKAGRTANTCQLRHCSMLSSVALSMALPYSLIQFC